MSDPDYKALCAELVELSAPTDSISQLTERLQKLDELANRARAALAQSEPVVVAPTDEELLASVRDFYGDQTAADMGAEDDLRTARAVLARYAHSTIQPVAGEVRELVELLQLEAGCYDPHFDVRATKFTRSAGLLQQLSALANQPEPQGPRDEELWELFDWLKDEWQSNNEGEFPLPVFARAVLARWGRSTIQPELVGVIDDELLRTYGLAKRDYCYEGPSDDWPKRAERAATIHGLRAVLARYSRPTIEPAS